MNTKTGEMAAGGQLLQFDSKSSYLLWRAEWKRVWKLRSEEQKKLRITLSKPHDAKSGWLQGQRYVNKMHLRVLLQARRQGKILSQQMKQLVLVS